MTLMPEIHDARAGGRGAGRRRRLRAGFLAVGVVVASGTAVAATGDWRPVLGSDERPRPRAAKSSVPAEQLAALEILRRPQTDADRGPRVRALLKVMSRENVNGIHTDGIRVVYSRGKETAILIPAARVGDPRVRPSVQRHVLCVWATSGPKTGWGGTCGGVDDLRYRGLETGTTLAGQPTNMAVPPAAGAKWPKMRRIVVVPDGVASVKVRLRGRRWVTARVRDNVYTFTTNSLPPPWASSGTTPPATRSPARNRGSGAAPSLASPTQGARSDVDLADGVGRRPGPAARRTPAGPAAELQRAPDRARQ